jgi:hypothetical protein
MSLEPSEDRIWKVKVELGSRKVDLDLYDTFDNGIVFKEDFIPRLKYVLTSYDHYSSGDLLTEVISPEGEDFSRYAVFLILVYFKKEFAGEHGEEHGFLFALRKDGRVHLAGISNPDLELEEFIEILSSAFEEPDKVSMFVMAYTPEK